MSALYPLKYVQSQQILLIIAQSAAREQMLEWIAMQACGGRVRVIDGGNQFNVYRVAKNIRRQTHRLHTVLQNIQISRSFSCYQMTALLEKTPAENTPLFLLDFLFSYYDEDIRLKESMRLLTKSIQSLKRLSTQAPLIISTRPRMYDVNRSVLLDEVKDNATQLWEIETQDTGQLNAPLLPWPQETQR